MRKAKGSLDGTQSEPNQDRRYSAIQHLSDIGGDSAQIEAMFQAAPELRKDEQ